MVSHLAVIMDGNRRWAKKRGMLPWFGHRQGAKTSEMIIRYCLDRSISYLSLYTLSLENLKRSEQEVSYLFSLILEIEQRIEEFVKAGVRVKFSGDLSCVPVQTYQACIRIQEATLHGSKLFCQFLFCYGGQQEILAATQNLIKDGHAKVSMDLFKQYLWVGNIPDPEIIIRTGGIQRLSNFLLFQAAYSEIRFLDCLWPDLTPDMLDATIQDCFQAQKNFGA